MKPTLLCSTLLIAAFFGGSSAIGEESLTKAEKRLAKVQENYELTGEVRSCIPLNLLRDSRVIDNQTIFFRGPGRKAYLNKLPRTCSRLVSEDRFAYRTSIGQLCHLDIITVVDSFGRSLSHCGLGKFEELQSKPSSDTEQPQG